jgi:hypothetical protein
MNEGLLTKKPPFYQLQSPGEIAWQIVFLFTGYNVPPISSRLFINACVNFFLGILFPKVPLRKKALIIFINTKTCFAAFLK